GAALGPGKSWVIEASGAYAQADANGGSFSRMTANLAFCPRISLSSSLRLHACAGADIQSIHGEGSGFHANFTANQPGAGFDLSARVDRNLRGPFYASLGAHMALHPIHPRFYYADRATGDAGSIYEMPLVAAAGEIGIGARFR